MRHWSGAAAAIACLAGTARAQQAPKGQPPQVAQPAPWARPSYLYSGVSSVFVSNIDHTPVGRQSYGALVAVGAQVRARFALLNVELEYDGVFRRYSNTDLWNRPGHVADGSLALRVNRHLALGVDGEVSLNGSTEDLVIRNEYSVQPQLEWRFNRKNRLVLYGEHLLKRYPDPLSGRDAVAPRFGFRFRQILGESRSWSFSGRYEYNRADSSRYRYGGWTAGVDAANPVGVGGRIWSSVRFRTRRYDSRLVSVGNSQVLRRDLDAVAMLGWEHLVWSTWSVALSYRFEAYTSNDARRKFEDHRVNLTMRRWW